MANWNISASAAPVLVDGLPSGVDNDIGTLRHAGTVADSAKFSSQSLGEANLVITVVSGVGNNTGVLGAGTFNNNAQQVIRRVTDDLAGVSNTELRSGGSNSSNRSDSIHQLAVLKTRYYKTAIRTNKWNEYSGVWDAGYPAIGDSGAWSIQDSADHAAVLRTSGTDDAANPTSAVPGELAYHYGSGGDPITDEYKERFLW